MDDSKIEKAIEAFKKLKILVQTEGIYGVQFIRFMAIIDDAISQLEMGRFGK